MTKVVTEQHGMLNKDKDPLAFMLFKFPGSVRSACVQETIFMLNFSNLKRKAPNVIFNLTIYLLIL